MSRIFVMDYELTSPLGLNRGEALSSLRSNRMGGRTIARFRSDCGAPSAAAPVEGDLSPAILTFPEPVREVAAHDRKLELLLACCHEMRPRLASFLEGVPPDRAGIILGAGLEVPDMETVLSVVDEWRDQPRMALHHVALRQNTMPESVNRDLNPLSYATLIVAELFDLAAFQKTILTACAASNQAVAFAVQAIRAGKADVVVTGGSDSLLNMAGYIGFSKLGVILDDGYPAERSCRPFDTSRRGTLLGEGAGLMVLVSESYVQRTGAEPALEVLGYGMSLDGHKITHPEPTGRGMKRAMTNALADARVSPDEVDYVNMHGTGTIANDPVEAESVISVFGPAAATCAASSTKDRHGHLIAAAGIQELGVLCLAMENDFVPCTVNLSRPIVKDGIDLVRNENRDARIQVGMSNSFAFGGVNSVIILRRTEYPA